MDYPPDDFTLAVKTWLKDEIYPGLLQEPWTDRADAVWVSGSGGWLGLWTGGFGSGLAPHARMELIKHELYRRIKSVKFRNPTTAVNRISGQLKVDNLGFADDNGPLSPLLCHFGEAFSAYIRRPDDVRQELDRIQQAGYHGIRFWDVLGYYNQNRPGDPNPWKAWEGSLSYRLSAVLGELARRHPPLLRPSSRFLR
jgi:hypothetical protein